MTPGVLAAGVGLLAVRLEPGEDVGGRLLGELDRAERGGAGVVAAVGSLRSLTYAVASLADDTLVAYRERRRLDGAIEVCSLQGHLGRDPEGRPGFHLHGAFALEDGRLVGGHVFEAAVLATLEVSLLLADALDWRIEPFLPPGRHDPPSGLRTFVPRPRTG